ncbi:MAG: hypothetical protein AAF675_14840 [Pseudomonadota bacterium]
MTGRGRFRLGVAVVLLLAAVGLVVLRGGPVIEELYGEAILLAFGPPVPEPSEAERTSFCAEAATGGFCAIWREDDRFLGLGVGQARGEPTCCVVTQHDFTAAKLEYRILACAGAGRTAPLACSAYERPLAEGERYRIDGVDVSRMPGWEREQARIVPPEE